MWRLGHLEVMLDQPETRPSCGEACGSRVTQRGARMPCLPRTIIFLGMWPGSVLDMWPGSVLGKWSGSVLGMWPGSVLGLWPGSVLGMWPCSVLGLWPGSVLGLWPGSVLGLWPGSVLGMWPGSVRREEDPLPLSHLPPAPHEDTGVTLH